MKKKIFYKSRFRRAYLSGNKKTAYPETIKAKSGVYLIQNTKGEIVYIGFSKTQLYKTMYRHFQSWKTSDQYRATFPKNYLLRVVICTPSKAEKLEMALIKRYRPKKNKAKILKYGLSKNEKHLASLYDMGVTPESEMPF